MRSAFGHLVPANDPSTRPSDKHTAYCAAERQSWASVGRLKTRSKFDTFGAASAVHLHCIKYNGEVLTVRWPMSVWCVWWSQSASQRSDWPPRRRPFAKNGRMTTVKIITKCGRLGMRIWSMTPFFVLFTPSVHLVVCCVASSFWTYDNSNLIEPCVVVAVPVLTQSTRWINNYYPLADTRSRWQRFRDQFTCLCSVFLANIWHRIGHDPPQLSPAQCMTPC